MDRLRNTVRNTGKRARKFVLTWPRPEEREICSGSGPNDQRLRGLLFGSQGCFLDPLIPFTFLVIF